MIYMTLKDEAEMKSLRHSLFDNKLLLFNLLNILQRTVVLCGYSDFNIMTRDNYKLLNT